MLRLASQIELAGGRFEDQVLLGARFRCQVIRRERVVYDSALAAPASASADYVHLMMVVQGHVEVAGQPHGASVAWLFTDAEFHRASADCAAYCLWGDPNLVIELTVPATSVRRPIGLGQGPVALGGAAWAAAAAVLDGFAGGHVAETTVRALISTLLDDGVLTAEALRATEVSLTDGLHRLWAVLAERYAEHAPSTTLREVAAASDVSTAQAARDFKALVDALPYLGIGYREIIRVIRLRQACQFLTAPEATPSVVAEAVGYSSLAAMDRAFRDAGMPSPTAIIRARAWSIMAR